MLTLLLLHLLTLVQAGKVNPYGSRYITMSNVNPSGWAEYNFTMTFDSIVPADGYVEIAFPRKDYPSQLGLGTNFQGGTSCDRGKKSIGYDWVMAISQTTYNHDTRNKEPGESVYNIADIFSGGTGNFKVYNKVGDFVIDANENFAVVGLAHDTEPLLKATLSIESGASQYAGETSNYLLTMVPSEDLPSFIDFKVVFPEFFDLSYLYDHQCTTMANSNGISLVGTLQCSVHRDFKNVLYFKGNAGPISKGQEIALKVAGVQNPYRKMKTPLFAYYIMESSTNNTLQQEEAVEGLTISAGQMKLVKMFLRIPSYLPYAGYLRWFTLQFRPKNPFVAARIMTDFFQIVQCQITRGLLDKAPNDDSVCRPSSRIMYLSNFAQYRESDFVTDYIEVQFLARIGYTVILTNPVEIYTYADEDHLLLVDQDVDSESTRVQVLPTPTKATGGVITSSLNTVAQPVTFTFKLDIGADYTYGNKILVEMDPLYTGLPICEYKGNGEATFKSYDCTLKDGMLEFNMANQNVVLGNSCGATCPILRVTNLNNPVYGNAYSVRFLLFGNGASTPSREFNTTVTIPIPSFTGSGTKVSPFVNNAGDKSAILVDMKIFDNLPAGVKNDPDPFVAYSYIEVWFKQLSAAKVIFSKNLGLGIDDMGNPGCFFQSGLNAALNRKLECALKYGADVPDNNAWTIVRIKNYAAINPGASGQQVVIAIPLRYPTETTVSPQVLLRLTRYDKKVMIVMREQLYSINSAKAIVGNPLGAANIKGPFLEQKKLQSDTTVTYYMKTIFNVPASGTNSIWYEVPSGFIFNLTKVQVSINDNYIDPSRLLYFEVFNIIFLQFVDNFPNGKEHKIQFEKVDLPISLAPGAITHSIKTTVNGQFADWGSFLIPSLETGQLFLVRASVSPTLEHHPYANYSIAFTTTMQSYTDASITVDFPAAFDFDQPFDPLLDNIPFCGLRNKSDLETISYAFAGQRATITNFAPLVKGQRVYLGLFSIKNPAAGPYNLVISVRSANGRVIEQATVGVEVTAGTYLPFKFDLKGINSLPDNAGSEAVYIFRFVPPQNIPKHSNIEITFPALYNGVLHSYEADKVNCRALVNGQLLGLRGCSVDATTNKVVIVPNAHLPANAEVALEYYGMIRYPNPGLSVGITLKINYKGGDIGQSLIVPPFTIKDSLKQSAGVTLSFDPQNEGEVARYEFKLPLRNFDLLSTYKIVVRFPIDYDPTIGVSKLRVSSAALEGALKVDMMPRHIFITGFYQAKNFTGTLDIAIAGVINPNRFNNNPTGTFLFGILDDYNLIAGDQIIPGVVPQLAPEGMQLIKVTSSTRSSRYSSSFRFDFTPYQRVKSRAFGGQIYVDFPDDFLIDAHSGSCDTTRSFSFFSSCEFEYFRFFFVTNNDEWNPSTHGPLAVTVNDVRTPDLEGETGNFIVYNYDSINKIVLGRTYNNLHEASISFKYDGAQIDVNNNEPIILEVGSYCDPIRINVSISSKNPITLSPNVLDARIIITPNPVQINIGEKEAWFRLAAPKDILLSEFYITWSKTGDTLPPTYSPVKRTKIQMVKGTIKRKLLVEPMEYLHQNSTSYPLYIYTNNPPYQEIIVRLSFYPNMAQARMKIPPENLTALKLDNYFKIYTTAGLPSFDTLSQANLSTNALYLKQLMDRIDYTINTSATYPDPTLTIYFDKAGVDADSFEFNTTQLTMSIRSQEFRKPKILDANILEVTRSTATFQIYGDAKGFLFYVYADQHMPDPTFEGTRFPNLTNETLKYSNPHYGVDYIRSADMDIVFTISGLLDNHDYEIFLFIMNLNGVYNPKFRKLYFKTMKTQPIALMTMRILQSFLAPEIKFDFIARLAEMISIKKQRIVERTTECNQTVIDQSPLPNEMYWNLLIMPDPTNMNELSTPLILAETLNSRRAEIKTFITRLDEDPFVQIKELQDNVPNFVMPPEMIERTITSIALRY